MSAAGAVQDPRLGNPVLINAVKAFTNYLHSLGVARNWMGPTQPMPVDMVTEGSAIAAAANADSEDTARPRRGGLKVYLGAAPGWAM